MALSKNEKDVIRRYCLQNAVFYKGKASPGAVVGKVMAEVPELRKKSDEVRKEIAAAVKKVNGMKLADQEKELKKLAPKMLKKKVKVQQRGLPELKGAVKGKVVTRFAPSPTGPLSLPHLLRPVFINYLYARKYGGKFVLRLEDSDPVKTVAEAYKWIQDDLKAAGVKPDKVVIESDHMEMYYRKAEELIKRGRAYVCLCSAEKFRGLKLKKEHCPERDRTPEESMKDWNRMLKGDYPEGEAVVRLKTDMSDPNPVLRDPPLLRVAFGKHPRTGTKHKVWPLYNFACVIEDHEQGVTHVFRGKEHEHNTAVQGLLYRDFGWKQPIVINFGMIYLPEAKIHTRDMKRWIADGTMSGWDDPRLPTAKALFRRGFQPETFRELAITCGLSKSDIRIGWENVEGINRKIVDPRANRVMAVLDPVEITVHGAKARTVELKLHPDFPKRGIRKVRAIPHDMYMSRQDWRQLRKQEFRLIGFGNIMLKEFQAEYAGDKIVKDMQKVQWVSKPNVRIKLIEAEETKEGIAEPSLSKAKVGDIVQLERIGFARIDKKTKSMVTLVFGHK
jgi:glutamyl-tRNA synthetase